MGKGGGDGYYQKADYEQVDHGEKYEKDDLWQGFTEERKFRDPGCGLFFIISLIGMAVVSGYAFSNGNLDVLKDAADSHKSKIDKDLDSLKDNRGTICVCALLTIALGFIWLELLKRCTKAFIWGSFAAAFIMLVAGGFTVYNMGTKDHASSPVGLKIAGVVLIVVAVLSVVVLFCMRKRIAFSAAIIEQGCRGLQANFSLITVVSPMLLLITLAWLAWWVFTLVYLFSIKGEKIDCARFTEAQQCEVYDCDWNSTACSGTGYDLDAAWRWAVLLMIFMAFWVTVFMAGVTRFSIACGLSRWYWDLQRDMNPIRIGESLKGVFWAFTYHLGTIAKGSFIIAVIKFVTWLLEMEKKEETNPAMRCALCIATCCCRCIESMVRFVTRFAYVSCAMHGKDFFDSAKEVNQLFSRQGGTMFLTDMIAHLVVRMGMFAAVGLVAFGGSWYWHKDDTVSASSVVVLIVVCATVFWVIGIAVEVAADTMAVCYLEDMERHDGDRARCRGPDDVREGLCVAIECNGGRETQKIQQQNPYGGVPSSARDGVA